MKVKRVLVFLCCLVAAMFFLSFIHEFGHSLPVLVKGGGITRMVVYGYELIPDFGRRSHISLTGFTVPKWPEGYQPTNFWLGLMMFSGSGSTLLVAIIASLLLWIIKPKYILKNILVAFSFHSFDIFRYSFLGVLGSVHSVIHRTEPIDGLIMMGLSKQESLAIVLIAVTIVMTIVFIYLKKYSPEKRK